MCFSASASFSASGMLFVIGFLTSRYVQKKEYTMLAAIPFLFSLQQLAEGTVWLTMGRFDYQGLHSLAVYTFLIFALSVWPSWVPISLLQCEQQGSRRKILGILSCIGLAVSAYTVYVLASYPVQVKIFDCSIWYSIGAANLLTREIDLLIYALAAVGPFFVSSLPFTPCLGGFILLSLFFTWAWMYTTLISVWCFFAALFSVFTYLILRLKHLQKSELH